MSQDRGPQARKTKKLYNEQPHFDINDYTDTNLLSISPPLLKKLHEDKQDALNDAKHLKEQLEVERGKIHMMALENKGFEVGLLGATANIERLTEDKTQAIQESKHLREQLEVVKDANHQMELQNLELLLRLEEANDRLYRTNWRKVFQLVVTVLATVIFSIGVNLATSKENILLGWGMITIGVILEVAAFLIEVLPKSERYNNGSGNTTPTTA